MKLSRAATYRILRLSGGLALVAGVYWINKNTPPDVRLGILYLIPVLLVTWHEGPLWGICFAAGTTLMRYEVGLDQVPLDAPMSHRALNEIVYLLVVAVAIAGMAQVRHAQAQLELLATHDLLTGVLNARTFSRLPRGAYVVNVARGTHLVEQDLLDALADGTLAAATLDVFREEPLPADHPFWREPRITITPHCSALTLRDEAISQVADKIGALARGETVSGVVHVGRGY